MGEDEIGDEKGSARATALRAAAEIERLLQSPITPGLYLVATPIGNLADISLRALAVLARADVTYCEDTRHSRTLLSHYSLRGALRAYHEHNAEEQRPRILAELAAGKAVALISDAGTPLISDPGFKLVRDAAAAGHQVVAIPGASAVLTALPVSGLPTDAFFFAGFLPAREGARRARIEELQAVPGSLIFFESPGRAAEALQDLAQVLGARPAALARELTKLHEDVTRGSLVELAAHFAGTELKGEVVIIVGPPMEVTLSDEDIEAQLETALKRFSVRDAAKVVADALKIPKGRVYDIALKVKQRETG